MLAGQDPQTFPGPHELTLHPDSHSKGRGSWGWGPLWVSPDLPGPRGLRQMLSMKPRSAAADPCPAAGQGRAEAFDVNPGWTQALCSAGGFVFPAVGRAVFAPSGAPGR